MEVIFFRHGIAMEQEEWRGDDDDRPLTKAGAGSTKLAAQGLRTLKVRPDILLSSPLVRARQTAEIVQEALGSKSKIEVVEDLRPNAPPERLFTRLAQFSDDSVVLCVGHEPHLSTTISAAISGKTAASIVMKKAAACAVLFSGRPQAGAGKLIWLTPPKALRLLGSCP
jgi:phosphohistidine phosphatase